MLRKKESFTVITPIPGFIPRQLAIDILHSHSEVITLNPLVLGHKPIQAPRDAQADEFYCTWYEITERIQYIPGIGKMGSGTIKFNGCFHDMPWGLQTHIYAPMNVDLRNKYRIAGNQPGVEPPEQPEIGLKSLGAPADGLYLREDIDIKCNVTVVGFVKAQMQKAGKEVVSRMIKKAELLDAGVLHAMVEGGMLKTINPLDRSNTIKSPLPSPTSFFQPPGTPQMAQQGVPYQVLRPQSYQAPYSAHPDHQQQQASFGHGRASVSLGNSQQFTAELPGDSYHSQSSPGPPSQHSNRDSDMSGLSNPLGVSPDPSQPARWSSADYQSQSRSRPTSYSSDTTGAGGGFRSPALDHKGFASELATHSETYEEHRDEHRDEALHKLDPRIPQQHSQFAPYNPQDYAKVGHNTQPHPYSSYGSGYDQQGRRYS
ncbi:hypothetical protein QBC33DRAFT_158558 [Phialemonium atrogriseum]|uniref:DUF7053 domain-containing protein n=1 Tax=Phialemonium atrogriseum TaxID=1093897 RepID=A0AAJ0FSZ4_9PEZI|nr:uncharacterized protein QBC33DRAFT_158558 [Phialemonium atrogriseum]KAK1771615.1 hypothetical protein QBC33DRAFT_158558 [Phialemonium atrogriseum]